MKTHFAALIFLLALATPVQSSQRIQGAANWEFDRKTGSWTSKDTGIVMRRSMAGFQRRDSSAPIEKDGTGLFAYLGKHCGITVVVEHRVTGGYPGAGDCTPRVRANYLRVMHQSYGRTDSESSFTLGYSSGGKRGRGVGTVCHFVSFPTFGNMPAYSEVGAILIGDFLFKYRCSFFDEAGWADLNAFLRTLGIKKANQAMQSLVITASTSSAETIVERLYRDPEFQLYGLALGITVDSHSKVRTLRVASVTDSRRDTLVRVRVPIPQSFLAAVRRRADQKHYPPKFKDGKPAEFFIAYWYSPTYPTVPISDWEKAADQQP